MTKQFDGVEAEKAEAMRRYNNQKRFRNIARAAALAFLCYLWFPVSIQAAASGYWFNRTGPVIVTNRAFVFLFVNILVALIVLLSPDHGGEEDITNAPDLYDQYTSVIVTASDDDSRKQIVPTEEVAEKQFVPAFIAEEEVVTTRNKVIRPATEFRRKKRAVTTELRRTESANSGIERLSSEEFRLKVEAFIMEKKRTLVQEENDVVEWHGLVELVGADSSSYGSC